MGKVTRKAISIALLAAMTTSALSSQASTTPMIDGTVIDVNAISYRDTGNTQNTEAENSAPDEYAQSEGSESVSKEEAEAGSNSDAAENSETASSTGADSKTTSSRTTSSYTGENSSYENYESTDSVQVEDENPLTSGNRTSGFISLDKQAIGFTKVGDVVSVTATTADDVKDKVVWRVADPERLRVRTSEQEGNASTAQIEWIGIGDADQTRTSFFAALESNPDEYTEGTAMLFGGNETSTDLSEQTENKELKTSFESPEVEEFLKQMYAEGLSQENSDYDLSKLFDDSADKTYTPYTDEVDEDSSALAVTKDESSYFELLSKNELSDTELIQNLTESNDEASSEAEKTAWEEENDRVSSY
ncbi:MAG: hypothetical protein IJH17_01475, partial [Clostridia bacterium]|nr:hypothetical protein [Clostridia bacterium]